MGLSDITDRQSILDAIAEFDHLRRHAFLTKYGFGRSKSYWLIHNGKRYDSKAIVGAAHGNARPDLGPLKAADFAGGEASVQSKLEQLGFTVEVNGGIEGLERTSTQLTPGSVYTRDDLRDLFEITDATLNTGVFRPKGTTSIWLFVTREKTADRTQYRDRLEGDKLYWQGQTSGRTDGLIIEHQARGLEILVFFRERKYEHPGAGFKFLGPFVYVSHTGSGPASFVLERQSLAKVSAEAADGDEFDPSSIEDARSRLSRTITQRRGQQAFRNALMAAYEGHCAVTDCSVRDVLEAAHIYPYRGPDTNKVANGLLLRADLHTLFDCGLIAVDEVTMALIIAPQLRSSEYGALHGRVLRKPSNPAHCPSKDALVQHRKSSGL